MDIIQSVILGLVEGITEFLPISSTGHLILASGLLRIAQTDFVKTFEISIQSGAILAVIVLYKDKLFKDFTLLKHILTAFIPTAVIGFILYKFIKEYLIGNHDVVLISLFIGGIALVGVELLLKKKESKSSNNVDKLSYEKAFFIGVFQSLAVIPGVSRSASSIVGGMLLGLKRETATEFSFLLAIPTVLAATALDLKETNLNFTGNETIMLLIGFVTSFIVALFAIKWLIKYVQTNTFIPFGIYRILLAIVYFLFLLI